MSCRRTVNTVLNTSISGLSLKGSGILVVEIISGKIETYSTNDLFFYCFSSAFLAKLLS